MHNKKLSKRSIGYMEKLNRLISRLKFKNRWIYNNLGDIMRYEVFKIDSCYYK